MIINQYYLDCLSQASYLIGDPTSGQAVVVDPRRDIGEYLADADEHGLQIVAAINTHFHADFVAGHLELAERTGAWIGYGSRAEAEYEIRHLHHGERVSLGEVELEILETPGHTWESISILVREHADDAPQAVLTGDALFIGDIGRPDLAAAVGASADELARAMHHTIHEILMPLPDEVRVLPGHGAGSACGKNLSSELESTIGAQRRTNLSVQPMDEDEFVERLTAGQPSAPAYFAVDAVLNRKHRALLPDGQRMVAWTAAEVRRAMAGGATVIDARDPDAFAAGHLEGSINVGIDGRFAETVGMVAGHEDTIVLVAPQGREAEAALRLTRIGFDHAVGYLADPDQALLELSDLVRTGKRIDVDELTTAQAEGATVVDVRNPGELEQGTIPGAINIPLAELGRRHAELPDTPVVVHCAGGWRSSVGASLLRHHGHADVSDLLGGYGAWSERTPSPSA